MLADRLITVARHQLVMELLLQQLITVARHQLVMELLLLIIVPLCLLHLRRVTIPEMQQGWMSKASWLCLTASALLLEFRRTSGVTPSPPTPRLGSTIWRQDRQAAS